MAYPYILHILVNDREIGIIENANNTNNKPIMYDIIEDSDFSYLLDEDKYKFLYGKYHYNNQTLSYPTYTLQSDVWWMVSASTASVTEMDIAFEHYEMTITYDAFGGKFNDGSTEMEQFVEGTTEKLSFTVPSTKPTRSGKSFVAWYGISEDGNIVEYISGPYKAGRTYYLNSKWDHTLHAIWTHTLSFDGNGGSDPVSNVQSNITIATFEEMPQVEIPQRQGFTFSGYYNGTTQYYDENGYPTEYVEYPHNFSLELTAWWKTAPLKAILNFKYSPTSAEIVESITEYSTTTTATVTIPEISMSRSNCDFVCWAALKSDGTFYNNMRYTAGDSINLTASKNGVIHTLTAIWRYKLWLDPNDDTIYNLNDLPYVWVVYYDCPPNLNENDLPELEGYKFKGYFTTRDSSDEQWYDSLGNGIKIWDRDFVAQIFAQWDIPLFEWTYEKRTGMEWRLHQDEWNELQDFINSKRSTPFIFTRAAEGMDFTAAMYNEVVDAIGKGTKVVKGQPITEKLMYEIVDNANAM